MIAKTMLVVSRRAMSSFRSLQAPVRCQGVSSGFGKNQMLRVQHDESSLQQQVRFYRGGAGDSPPNLSPREEELLKVAKPKAAVILAEHHKLPNLAQIPKDSLDTTADNNEDDSSLDNIRRKRLIYRAKQRGWLEVDLLLGTWASENVMQLKEQELNEFEDFVNMETIDIYNIITLRTQPEPTATNKKMVQRIQDWARGNPLGKADPDTYRTVKASAKLT
jgi:succinate dehydrogenase assembly factor 2